MSSNGSPFDRHQMRLIDMMARGISQKEMADLLHLNYNSLRRHIMYCRAEVGALSNEHLIAICFRKGWLPLR
jgi:DNA-binding CsgD family transcriptional regulator